MTFSSLEGIRSGIRVYLIHRGYLSPIEDVRSHRGYATWVNQVDSSYGVQTVRILVCV